MASMTVSVGERRMVQNANAVAKAGIYESIERLAHWLEKHDYRGYDTFDGLNARFVRPLTFEQRLPAYRASARDEAIPRQFAPAFGSYQRALHQRNGFSGTRLHPLTPNDRRSSLG